MKMPERNHHKNRRQNAAPLQRCDNRASFFRLLKGNDVGKLYMPHELGQLLQQTIELELPNLRALSEEHSSSVRGRPGSWSPKEELGHLIDSAANNHIRFVLASIDGEFRGLGYAQDKWVEAHGYREFAWQDLVDLWYRFNSLLANLIARIPEEHLSNRCVIGWGVLTLGFVIEDYELHMRHHLDHILSRQVVTPYPAAPATPHETLHATD
jgi:hypothetical protein